MRRADRLFQIIQLLKNRRLTTASLLAEVLEVSTRTIYRDIQDLIANDIPVVDGEELNDFIKEMQRKYG
jgi:predicted DNA-binding transcriptional regulator YafY